ncbi:hypothetical protein G9A89_013199 [Geosiphon pyriformis]|nr:hypothetical protein G9A89_013199 [Geosiphon pyriformis]
MSSDPTKTTEDLSIVGILAGFTISLGASLMNAAGLNLLNLDHIKNASRPEERQRNECGRPLWHLGLYLYIASQSVGSTLALYFLKAQWVAPLGSVSLIFNFLFARAFVGTPITQKDILGTFVVIASVVWIVAFAGMNQGEGDGNLTLEKLKALFMRPLFIAYFSVLEIITIGLLGVALYSYWFAKNELRKKSHVYFRGLETKRLKKWVGMTMAGLGGLIASQTLLLAKSGVKLLSKSIGGNNQFTDRLSWFILVGLAVTAVLQVFCLNTALKLHDSVLVVPIFYGFYTAMGLINSMIYLNELASFPPWALFLVMLGIGTLVYGVLLLSQAKDSPEGFKDEINVIQKNESMLSVGTWDNSSVGGISTKDGSDIEILNHKTKKLSAFERISQSRISGGASFFKMARLRKNSTVGRYTKQRRRSSAIDTEGDSFIGLGPQVVIDYDPLDDDEMATNPRMTSHNPSYTKLPMGNVSLEKDTEDRLSITKNNNSGDNKQSITVDSRSFDDLLSTNQKEDPEDLI